MLDPIDRHIRPFRPGDEEGVRALWKVSGLLRPWNDPGKDIARKMGVLPELFLVCEGTHSIIGTVMAGYDGHRGWLYYLAVSPNDRRLGIGRALVCAAEERLKMLGCPKVNLQIRTDHLEVLDFYQDLGFSQETVISMGKRLIKD